MPSSAPSVSSAVFGWSIIASSSTAGDFALLLVSLAFLRIRSLRQRRADPDLADRLRQWRRSLLQLGVALLLSTFVIALKLHGGNFARAMARLDVYFLGGFIACIVLTQKCVRRLPQFLLA